MKREKRRKNAALFALSLATATIGLTPWAPAATASWAGANRVLATNSFWINSTPPGSTDEAYFGTLETSGGAPLSIAFKGTGTTPAVINLSWGSAVFDAVSINTGGLEIQSSLSTTNTGAATLTLNGDGVATDNIMQLTSNVTGIVDFHGSGATAGFPLTMNLGVGQIDVEEPSAVLQTQALVAGSAGITKVGSGELYLYNATGTSAVVSTFTGGITVNAGTVAFNNPTALGDVGNTITINNGTFEFLPKTPNSSESLAATQSITLGSVTSQIDISSGNTLAIPGSINGSGALIEVDTGTLVLAGSNSYSGGTNISAGALQVGQSVDMAPLTSPLGSGSVTNSTSLYFSSSQATAISNAISGSGSVTQNGTGTTTLSGANNYSGGTNVSAGSLIVGAAGALPNSSVNVTGGTLQLAPNTGAQTISSLSISGNGRFDLSNNRLYIGSGTPISSIAVMLTAGFDNGAWDGPGGINSSAIAANPGYSIGVASSADPGNPAGVPSGEIEIAYTRSGDANLDGKVNAQDFSALAAHYGSAGGWTQGDFNYDGIVNTADFNLLASNFNQSVSPSTPVLGALVPEPASLGILILAAAALKRRCRKDVDVAS